NLDQSAAMTVDQMKGAIPVCFRLRDIVTKPRDRPVPSESTSNAIRRWLVGEECAHAANVCHPGQLHRRLPQELASDGGHALEALGDNRFTCFPGVVAEVCGYL